MDDESPRSSGDGGSQKSSSSSSASFSSSPTKNHHTPTEELDPRIHLELERLNSNTDQINKLEKELEETNEQFRVLLSAHASVLEKVLKSVGRAAIDNARPYYVHKERADDLRKKCSAAALQFQRANDVCREAKKSIQQAESRYLKESQLDGTCQEILNHLTMQVMDAEKQKSASELRHRALSEQYFEAEKKVHSLEKLLGRDIVKSKSYFDMKNSVNSTLEELKTRTIDLQTAITEAKRSYSHALTSLEMISNEIHFHRSRMPGEGAEQRKESTHFDE